MKVKKTSTFAISISMVFSVLFLTAFLTNKNEPEAKQAVSDKFADEQIFTAESPTNDINDIIEQEPDLPEGFAETDQIQNESIVPASANDFQDEKFILPLSEDLFNAALVNLGDEEIGVKGIDISAPRDTEIFAAAGGKIILAEWYYGYGLCVIIEHDSGLSTLYAHCSQLNVAEGDSVTQGQVIALTGSTGTTPETRLHFVIKRGEEMLNLTDYLIQ